MTLPALAGAQARPGPVPPARVLVVENTRSADSTVLAQYYLWKRKIPYANLCRIACPPGETCSLQEYREQIRDPVRQYMARKRIPVDYIVLTKGIPLRVNENGCSPDSLLAAMELGEGDRRLPNPYFGKAERFSHVRHRLYLVTRLTGYTRSDGLKLVDRALAAQAARGPFLLHVGPGHDGGGYRDVNDGMIRADRKLKEKRLQSDLSLGETFAGGKDLMGYFSWGSNDGKFDRTVYRNLTFRPGAVAETAVSTSARTFENPDAPGQSLIGDLVAQGVTGVKGYVSEPYADAVALADILFDRYTAGYTLGESFYMASRFVRWKDLVVGDPLCAPYAARAATTQRNGRERFRQSSPAARAGRRKRAVSALTGAFGGLTP